MEEKTRLILVLLFCSLLVLPFIFNDNSDPDHRLYSKWVENPVSTKYVVVPFTASIFPFGASQSLKVESFLFYLGIIFFTYLIVKQIFNPGVALVSSLIVGLNPLVTRETIRGMMDVPVTFFYCATVYFLLRVFREDSIKDKLIFVLLSILTIFTKNTGSLLFFVFFMFFLSFKDRAKQALLYSPLVLVSLFSNRKILKGLFDSSFDTGILYYLRDFNFLKIVIALSLLTLVLYSLKGKEYSKAPALWFIGYLIGLMAVQPKVLIARHFLPLVPAMLVSVIFSIELLLKKYKLENHRYPIYIILCLSSIALSLKYLFLNYNLMA